MENAIENIGIGSSVSEGKDRFKNLPLPLQIFFIVICTAAMLIAVYVTFSVVIGGYIFTQFGYYYILFALVFPGIFLIAPLRKKDKAVRWIDLVFAAFAFGIPVYFFFNSWEIEFIGWLPPSTFNFALALIFCLLILEGARRATGSIVFVAFGVIFAIYPLIAEHMPGALWGVSYPFSQLIGLFVFGGEGVVGLPGRVIGDILIGFLIFAGMLIASGAGKFFMELAFALVGHYRGGAAKVAVIASGLVGTMTGNPPVNVIITGSVTIPTMKSLGYPAHYAAAIEACASTGGPFMPPVMGMVAFVMCIVLGVPYAVVVKAAVLPAILYYFGLMLGVDGYAAKAGLRGLPKEECPRIWPVLRRGWPFLTTIVFMFWGLLYMRWEMMTPFYATGLLIILSFANRETMMTPRRFLNSLIEIGKMLTTVVAMTLPIVFILSSLAVTGITVSIVSSVIYMGSENMYLILLIGVIACYIMGMGGLVIPAYVILAVTLAPALIKLGGLNALAVHLFIIYYSMLAGMTAPVAISAFVAAAIARCSPMKTAVTAMRLGVVVYFVPIYFLFYPALILEGPILETLYIFTLCVLGIIFIVAGLEGYLLKLGRLESWSRVIFILAGFLLAFPERATTYIGCAMILLVIAIILMRRKKVTAYPTNTG